MIVRSLFRSRAALFALALLAGCSAVDPYPTSAGSSEPSDKGPRVAICYNTLHSTLPQVRDAARQECGAGTEPEPVATDWRLQNCPLLLPSRAIFVCTKK